jgi:hypothetical protein
MKDARALKPQVIAVQFPLCGWHKQNIVEVPVEKIRNESALHQSEEGV